MTETVVKACLLASSTKLVFYELFSTTKLTPPAPSTLALLESLTRADDQLAATVKPLINVLRNADSGLVSCVIILRE